MILHAAAHCVPGAPVILDELQGPCSLPPLTIRAIPRVERNNAAHQQSEPTRNCLNEPFKLLTYLWKVCFYFRSYSHSVLWSSLSSSLPAELLTVLICLNCLNPSSALTEPTLTLSLGIFHGTSKGGNNISPPNRCMPVSFPSAPSPCCPLECQTFWQPSKLLFFLS